MAPGGEIEVSYTGSLEGVDAADWRRLAERAGHVFATREWLLTWWRHYGKARRQLIGLARRDDDLVVILPLYERWARGVPVLRFLGHGPGDQLGPVSAPLSDPVAASAVRDAIGAIPLRQYMLLAERMPGDQRFDALMDSRLLYREATPVMHVDSTSWDEFLEARGRNFRQQVRRFPRKISEFGTLSYRLASDPERLDQDLDTLFHLHRLRWGTTRSPFLVAARFQRDFAAQAFRQGWLRLWFLEIDGHPVAALEGFRFAGTEQWYQAGRDPALEKQRVGFVLLTHALRAALEDGIHEHRLGRGEAAYKHRFATHDPTLATYGAARGAGARLLLASASGARSLGLRQFLGRV